jgi:hypothetical protein
MKKYLAIFIQLMFILAGCNRNVDCPIFDSNILNWLPYQKGDTITMTNQTGDSTLFFFIRNYSIEHKTGYAKKSNCTGCDDDIYINDENYGIMNFSIDFYINQGQIIIENYYVLDSHFDRVTSSFSEQSSYVINGQTYETVRIFENTPSLNKFKKLIIAKDHGIAELVDQSGKCWCAVSSKSASAEGFEGIDYSETSCAN